MINTYLQGFRCFNRVSMIESRIYHRLTLQRHYFSDKFVDTSSRKYSGMDQTAIKLYELIRADNITCLPSCLLGLSLSTFSQVKFFTALTVETMILKL